MELKRNDGGGDFFMGKKITKRIGGVDSHQVYKLHLSHKQKGENTVIRHLSHTSAKTESENNRPAAQGTVTELHPAAH